jgi:hypothetical protein
MRVGGLGEHASTGDCEAGVIRVDVFSGVTVGS